MSTKETREATVKSEIASMEVTTAALNLVAAAFAARACELKNPSIDFHTGFPDRQVVLHFSRPDLADAFIDALRKATGQ